MADCGWRTPSVRLFLAAGVLVLGEIAGFSVPRIAEAWAMIGFFALVALLAAYGWGGRRLGYASLFALGLVFALRTDARLLWELDENAGLHGPRGSLVMPVEGEANLRRRDGRKAGFYADFPSHVGPVPLKVIVPVACTNSIPHAGETWEVDGWISRKQDRGQRFGRRTFWATNHLRARRLETSGTWTSKGIWEKVGKGLALGTCVGLEWCRELAGLNSAILLGRRGDLSPARKRIFADAGTIHLFAISGTHVMVVAWMINVLLLKLEVPLRARGLVCIPLVWAYVVLTGARPSAVRAALMSTLWLVAPVLGRRPDSLVAWSVTALIVYGFSPERLFDLGCTLSFTVMFGIVLWIHWSRRFRPWFAEGSRLREWAGEFGISFAAWVAGVPFAAYAFGRFTPGGLLANILVIRCAKWMVRFGAGGLVAGTICIPLAALLNNIAVAFTWGMSSVSEWVAALPFSNFVVEPWTIVGCTAWYVIWLAVFLGIGHFLPRHEHVARRWWK